MRIFVFCAKFFNQTKIFSCLQIEIEIQDENDNSPTFTKRFYSVRFPSNTLMDSIVATIQAIDEDSSSSIEYSFNYDLMNGTENDEDLKRRLLKIDPTSGEIKLDADLSSDEFAELIDQKIEYFVSFSTKLSTHLPSKPSIMACETSKRQPFLSKQRNHFETLNRTLNFSLPNF